MVRRLIGAAAVLYTSSILYVPKQVHADILHRALTPKLATEDKASSYDQVFHLCVGLICSKMYSSC